MAEEVNTEIESKTNETNENKDDNMISMTKEDFDKAIQSAEDRLRTSYSKQMKELQDKLPKEKSKSEIDIETKIKALEDKQKEIDRKEKYLNLQDTLSSKNLPKELSDYLKDDIDMDKFESVVNTFVTNKTKSLGYNPTGHQTNDGVSKEQWNKMSYTEKAELFAKNPTLANKLMGR